MHEKMSKKYWKCDSNLRKQAN